MHKICTIVCYNKRVMPDEDLDGVSGGTDTDDKDTLEIIHNPRGIHMYIVKNAFRCIGRAKGRNVLIGIIALVIAISACLGLSIRQAAESAKTSALANMSITATISFNRNEVINQIGGGRGPGSGGSGGGFDRDQYAEMMSGASNLTLEEYKTYATANSVQSFYYTLTAYFDGSDALSPIESSSSSSGSSGFPMGGGMGGGMPGGKGFSTGEFTIVG